jgi:hypothetical protein
MTPDPLDLRLMRQSAADLADARAVLQAVRDHAEPGGSLPWGALALWLPTLTAAQLRCATDLCVRAGALERCDLDPRESRWRLVEPTTQEAEALLARRRLRRKPR